MPSPRPVTDMCSCRSWGKCPLVREKHCPFANTPLLQLSPFVQKADSLTFHARVWFCRSENKEEFLFEIIETTLRLRHNPEWWDTGDSLIKSRENEIATTPTVYPGEAFQPMQ